MKERTRNIAVGLTVIVSLILLGALVLIFTGVPELLQRGYLVKMRFPVTYDIATGDDVHLRGIRVGKVIGVSFADPRDPTQGVIFTARIDGDVRLPANTKAVVFTRGLVGKGYLELAPEGEAPLDRDTGKPLAHLPTDGSAVLEGIHRGSELFPPELSAAFEDVSKLAKTLNEALGPSAEDKAPATPTSQTSTAPTQPTVGGLRGTIVRLNRALDSLNTILGSGENQSNMKAAISAMAEAANSTSEAMKEFKLFADQARQSAKDISGFAGSAGEKFDVLAEQLIQDAEDISRLMVTLEQTVRKLESGEGTAGKLINDPQLYNAMLDATQRLTELLTEARVLVDAWRASGVELKVK